MEVWHGKVVVLGVVVINSNSGPLLAVITIVKVVVRLLQSTNVNKTTGVETINDLIGNNNRERKRAERRDER